MLMTLTERGRPPTLTNVVMVASVNLASNRRVTVDEIAIELDISMCATAHRCFMESNYRHAEPPRRGEGQVIGVPSQLGDGSLVSHGIKLPARTSVW
ncbi:hypothetical protein AVEN_104142-1 [Araneus ventricosus]|uniref:Uncharacterized protein n=1 Tax=Araneus ventricosus TaxID=182803 RepID=A0A4Y2I6M2_ARAVE|nr:hypothetical protein AVEN_104142-1 [Araneus ventricosus]